MEAQGSALPCEASHRGRRRLPDNRLQRFAHPMNIRPLLTFGVLAMCMVAAHADPIPVAQYRFNDSLASSAGSAPALTVTDPLGLSGFGTDTVFGVAQTVWNFQGTNFPVTAQAGLTLNTAGLITDSSIYSVEMQFKFTERSGAWRRILDVENRQSDNGFYVDPSNNLDIYPVAGGAAFSNDVYHDVFLVNNGGTVAFYLDGSTQATVVTPVMNLNASQTMNFFLDNVVAGGQGEYSSGSIALIRVYNEALTTLPPPPPPVPEVPSVALLAAGLATLGIRARLQRAA
jgi:hypothetical protein